ncbi:MULTISPECIES: dodecin [unclassified Caballeronia]|uniref:dodecin n=1 Tax=unclassified Caballeronia TaxID=2646786 RepID=UPI00285756D2|nr:MULTISPECIES: dodecin [unclassified Caballeronia]MDR5760588.1 dodecin family protein [Caballeronia sp. LZ035]MDR5763306.1 dodecin family protein [Caballeronia sp. LZ035]MDR5822441.1 dodecin family protein [Caballeronia sp. LZ043]
MSEHVYELLEVTGSSPISSDNAVAVALEKASGTVRNIEWFQVTETRGHTEGGKILHWQVTLKLGFRVDD